MLRIVGKQHWNCDGHSRREFLTAGMLGLSGFTLADLLRTEAAAGVVGSRKAIINIHLDGGPPQMDMIDPKPQAPAEIRGEFAPIATAIPGLQIGELLPKLATISQKLVFIRSLVGSTGQHNAFQCQSGFDEKDLQGLGGRPALGCVAAKLLGTTEDEAPVFVDLMQGRPLVRNSARAGFLGPAFQPFRPDLSRMFARPLEEGMKRELAARGQNHTTELKLHPELNANRLHDRDQLRSSLDRYRRDIDNSGMMDAQDRFSQQAASILTSGHFAAALDLSQEESRVLERYTAPLSGRARFSTAEDEFSMRKLLLARRLIEAGVRCVSVSFSDFDTHSGNFARMRQMLPIFDHGLHALVTDLEERGILDDVTIVAWGEFGRTPKINSQGGRDHWPRVGMALMAGGGLRTGQVLGATDRDAATAIARPVTYQEMIATLFHKLGIPPQHTTLNDPSGRPRYLVEQGLPISEII